MNSSSKFDIVVYGATGFTGQLVAEYLATHYRDDKRLTWAMAGRSLDKLKSVRDAIGASADTPLLAACAASGTDYVDLCGEPVWMRQMIDAQHATAQRSGARIVFSCGFDSLP